MIIDPGSFKINNGTVKKTLFEEYIFQALAGFLVVEFEIDSH